MALSSSISTILELPPCCIESSPIQPDCFFIGTYFLEKTERVEQEIESDELQGKTEIGTSVQQRSGSIVVLRVDTNPLPLEAKCTIPQDHSVSPLEVEFTFPTSYGILDLHFSPHDSTVFGTANSTNSISLFSTSFKYEQLSSVSIDLLGIIDSFPMGTLALALQWHPLDSQILGVSLSNGEVVLLQFDFVNERVSGAKLNLPSVRTLIIHDLEAWTLSFTMPLDSRNQVDILSGGDDSTLRFASISSGKDDDATALVWKDSRSHSAGVTAILPLTPNIVLTGSYDDNIRIVQIPFSPPFRPRVLAEENLGGGVWRLKMIPQWSKGLSLMQQEDGEFEVNLFVLASCMYAGAKVLHVTKLKITDGGDWRIMAVASMEEHKSMNYGSDFLVCGGTENLWVLSTSFYDKLICLTHIPRTIQEQT